MKPAFSERAARCAAPRIITWVAALAAVIIAGSAPLSAAFAQSNPPTAQNNPPASQNNPPPPATTEG